MKTILIKNVWIVILFCAMQSHAQPQIQFETVEYDYGTIKEEDGPQKGVFVFTNNGNEPLRIVSVRASCGCTASNYTREEVAPGAKGMVEATYNPANRPGRFAKSLSVTTNDPQNSTVGLIIKGDVTPKPKTKADNYPSKIGNLRFKTNHVALQQITNKEVRSDTLKVYNEGKQPITINTVKENSDFISISNLPLTLQHDEEGYLILTYDASKRNDFGYVFDRFHFETNDVELPEKLMYVSANILYDFSNMSDKDKQRAPKIVFENETYQYGKVKSGEIIEHDFVFKNEGKNPLKILKAKPSCGCTGTVPEKTTLKKGESSKINVKFNTQGRNGHQHHNITLHTNDPERPVIVIYIQGEVIQ
jgi:hypothetical protein